MSKEKVPHPWFRPRHLLGWYQRGDRFAKVARLRAEADRDRREIEALRYALTYARKRYLEDILLQIRLLSEDALWREEKARRLEAALRSPNRSPEKSNDIKDLLPR